MRPEPIINDASVQHMNQTQGSDSGSPPSTKLPVLTEAQTLYSRGCYTEALQRLDTYFETTTDAQIQPSTHRDAILLRSWCLIEAKQHQACDQWLNTCRQKNLLTDNDLSARILDLNIRLFNEHYSEVQQAVETLLPGLTTSASLEHAELRLLLGAALRWQGRLSEAVSHVEYACSAFMVLGVTHREAVATNFLGWTFLSQGRFDGANRWFTKSLRVNTELNAPLRMAQNLQNLAIVAYKQGDYTEAVGLLQKELKLVDGHPDMICRARIALGNVKRLQGDWATARSNLLSAYALAKEAGFGREETLALEFLGDVFRDEGNPGEAGRYYERGLEVATALAPRGDLVMELQRRIGECLDLEGRHTDANGVLGQALALCTEVGDRYETAVTHRCLGQNAAGLGRWKVAAQQLRTALGEFRELDARHEMMIASYHMAQILTRQIDTGNARARSHTLLTEAWQHALAAHQLRQELRTTFLKPEIRNLVDGLASRRSPDREAPQRPTLFSARRAPATRIIAVSASMQGILRRLDGYARYDDPVLINGENGCGKELLARRLHENSQRSSRPFVRVSCTATAVDVLTAELFGSTGADGDRPGLVSQADGGTLLLDGIGDLPRQLQAGVLRLIQEGTYRPLGDGRQCQADVRIVATTDTDLNALTERNQFRSDLLFRLRLMSVNIAPLRQRPEDVMPLLDHFLTRLEGSSMTARSLFDFQALADLSAYHWPGGAEELEAVAQQAWLNRDLGRPVTLRLMDGAAGKTLAFQESVGTNRKSMVVGGLPTAAGPNGHPSGMTWSSLNSLIDRAGGNKTQVAKNLGISRITLYRWLDQLSPQDR